MGVTTRSGTKFVDDSASRPKAPTTKTGTTARSKKGNGRSNNALAKRKHEDDNNGGKTDYGQPTKKQKVAEAHSNTAIPSSQLQRRMLECWRSRSNVLSQLSDLQSNHDFDHAPISTLSPDTVVLAIASVWQGLADEGIHYSYGDEALFDRARYQAPLTSPCVPGSDTLIIPLFFKGKKFADTPETVDAAIHQWPPVDSLLAIVKKHDDDKIHFVFLYSWPVNPRAKDQKARLRLSSQFVEDTVQSIVRNCGWLPADQQLNRDKLTCEWQKVPQAFYKNKLTTSGHHMILNAWAYMLDIPLREEHGLLIGDPSHDLYKYTEKLIRLALEGRLDGQTIREFMLDFKYAKPSDNTTIAHRLSSETAVKSLSISRSFLMNAEILKLALQQLREYPSEKRVSRVPKELRPTSTKAQGTSHTAASQPSAESPLSSNVSVPAPLDYSTTISIGGNWHAILNHNLTVFEGKVEKMSNEDKAKCLEVKDDYLTDKEVILVIGCVWDCLWKTNHRIAYGSEATFLSRSQETTLNYKQWAAGDTSMPFLMPLRGHGHNFNITPEAADKVQDAVGHWILAVAEIDKKNPDQVNIRWMSSTDYGKTASIHGAAESVVRYSGWLGMRIIHEDGPLPFHGTFSHERSTVPQQSSGRECGFHVIMCAWAIMLNIPISATARLRGGSSLADFYTQGRRVINCALAGHMNTRTIQALLNTYGFSVDQDMSQGVPQATMTGVFNDNRLVIAYVDAIFDMTDLPQSYNI